MLPYLVFHYPGDFFDQKAPVRRLGINYLSNPSLFENRVCLEFKPRIKKHIPYVLEAAWNLIHQIFTFARLEEASCNRYHRRFFTIIAVAAGTLYDIRQYEGHLGHPLRLLGRRTGKYNILHTVAPETLCALLSQDPFECIYDIAFSTAVRPYY